METSQGNPGSFKHKWNAWVNKRFALSPVEADICLTAVIVVISGALMIVAINWDVLLLAIFLAFTLCCAVVVLTSGIALLQEETIETAFPISIPFDLVTNNLSEATLYVTEETPEDIAERLLQITRLAHESPPPTTQKEKELLKKGRVVRLKKDTIVTACGEFLQYQIFKLFYTFQYNLWMASQEKFSQGTNITPAHTDAPAADGETVNAPRPSVKDPLLLLRSQYQGESLWNIVSVNRFAVVESERIFLKTAHLFLPEGGRLTLNYVVSSPDPHNLGYNLQVVKPWFFEMRITVAPMIPIEWEVPPPQDDIASDEEKRTVVIKYTVRLKVHFHQLTAGNYKTDELKAWTRRLFKYIKTQLTVYDLGRLWEERPRTPVAETSPDAEAPLQQPPQESAEKGAQPLQAPVNGQAIEIEPLPPPQPVTEDVPRASVAS